MGGKEEKESTLLVLQMIVVVLCRLLCKDFFVIEATEGHIHTFFMLYMFGEVWLCITIVFMLYIVIIHPCMYERQICSAVSLLTM